MATVTIRNKRTGETKTIPQEDFMKFGVNSPKEVQLGNGTPQGENTAVQTIQARLQELGQPQQTQQEPQGDFMTRLLQSRALPIGGSMLAGGVTSMVNPLLSPVAATAGYAGGDVIRKELSSLFGIEGKQGEKTPESVGETAKGAVTAGVAQGIGETAGFALKFIKPGTIGSFLSQLTDRLSKKGFGNISKEALEVRFMDEVIPKALRFTQAAGADVEQGAKELFGKQVSQRVLDAQDLNFLRKNLNAIGEGAEGMKDALIKGLAKIVREEQLKRSPGAAVTLPAEKGLHETIKGLRAFWPTRMALMISDAMRSAGAGIGSAISRFGGAPLIGGMSRKE